MLRQLVRTITTLSTTAHDLTVRDMTAQIEFIGQDDKTIVRITENGRVTAKALTSTVFAHPFAAGQAIRLGLAVPEDAKKRRKPAVRAADEAACALLVGGVQFQ